MEGDNNTTGMVRIDDIIISVCIPQPSPYDYVYYGRVNVLRVVFPVCERIPSFSRPILTVLYCIRYEYYKLIPDIFEKYERYTSCESVFLN